MTDKSVKLLFAVLTAFVFLLLPVFAFADDKTPVQASYIEETTTITRTLADGSIETTTISGPAENIASLLNIETDSLAYPIKNTPKMSHIRWGLELGTGLDLSGTDLSTFNFDIIIGYRNKFINTLGIMAGVHKSLGTRDTFLPLKVVFRSSFNNRPSLAFFHFSAGYSFNTVSSSPMFGDITGTVGCGFNLVQRPRFQSNIMVGFGFRHFNRRHREMTNLTKNNVGFAQISFGISM